MCGACAMLGAPRMDGHVLLGLNEVPTLNAVLKALKREEASLYSCVASILDDALFVEQVAALYPALPLFPNLRCGAWYVRPPIAHTCYFKSTDGHNGNWSFSTVRLNLQVAEAAAAAGGCVVVDATKRGKRFPDAMNKTIPMWAAVVNRAVRRLRLAASGASAAVPRPGRAEGARRSAGSSPAAAAAAEAGGGAAEAAAVAAAGGLPPGWQTADTANWDEDVHLPAWVSAHEARSIRQLLEGWVDQLLEVGADLSTLAATLRKPLRCMWISQDSRIWLDRVADTAALDFTPIVLVCASATTARQRRCLTLPPGKHAFGSAACCERPGEEPFSVTYCYFPGAADDEEKWACGLSPELMWCHRRALMAAGPAGVEPLVKRLLVQQREQQLEISTAVGQPETDGSNPMGDGSVAHEALGAAAASAAAGAAAAPPGVGPAAGGGPHDGAVLRQPAGAGLHCLLPQGFLPAQATVVQQLGSGIFLLGTTGLALSNAAAAAAPAVWQHVDAVLHLGTLPPAGLAIEPLTETQQQQQQSAEEAACGVGSPAAAAACRYRWLPVRDSKQERQSLQLQLSAALRFACGQLEHGRRLLVCCDSGLDMCVCVAVACLLAFFRLREQPEGSGGGLTPVWAGPQPAGSTSSQPMAQLAATLPRSLPPVVGAAGFSKLAVRQHLAAVSVHYPVGRPTRASLRQVFNFFLTQLAS